MFILFMQNSIRRKHDLSIILPYLSQVAIYLLTPFALAHAVNFIRMWILSLFRCVFRVFLSFILNGRNISRR